MTNLPDRSLDLESFDSEGIHSYLRHNVRHCPQCGEMSIWGMPGGRDATCKSCGYKDPCCYD